MPASFYLGILHMEQYELFAETMSDSEAPVALEEVFAAYYECRRCKRRTVNALAFELLKIEIRLCVNLNILSIKKLAQLSLLMDSIGRQASAWRKKAKKA